PPERFAPRPAITRAAGEFSPAEPPRGAARCGRGRAQSPRPFGPAAGRRTHRCAGMAVECQRGVAMSRLSSLFWVLLVVVAGFTTFKVKYAVQDIEDQLARARKQTIAEQQEIRVLTAEWSYLNQPERLADLNRRFFGLAPIAAKQLQHRIEDIPLRPPAPISEPELAIATNATPEPAPAGDAARLPTPTPSASVAARTP